MPSSALRTPASSCLRTPPPPTMTVLSRRPALGAAAGLITGILLHPILPDHPWLWIAIAAALALASLLSSAWQIPSTVALAIALLAAGVAVAQLQRFHFPANHIVAWTTDAPRLARLEIQLDQPPRTLTGLPRPGRPPEPRQIASGQVTRILTTTGWRDATGAITLHVTPPAPALAFGQRITALGHLSRPAPAGNPGEFDWARYYRDQRILASFSADAPNIRIVAPARSSWLHALRQSARAALARGFGDADALDHALLRALVLGDSDPQLRDVQYDFQRTGTSHHLAISGMHIAVLGACVFFLCRLFRRSPRASAAIMLGFVWIYGLAALPSPPVVRSILLCTGFGVGILLRRSMDGIQLLAVTVLAMLVYQPLDLYNAGFQLSFGTVLGLMIFATPLARAIHQPSEDERVLRSFGIEPSRALGLWQWFRGKMVATLAAGIVAWSVSAPLIMQHFDQLNPWAIPASILLAPLVFLALIGGLLKISLTLLFPWLAPAWAAAAGVPITWMRGTVTLFAKVPGSDLPMPALSGFLVALYYLLLALPLIPLARRWLKWLLRGGAATAVLALLLIPAIGFAPRRGNDFTATLLAVGAGQCCIIRLPSGRTILIDAGSSGIADLDRRTIAPFLRHHGITTIDAIFISHANIDHFSAVADLADERPVSQVYLSPFFESHARQVLPARQMLQRLRQRGVTITPIAAGTSIPLDTVTTLDVLWPAPGAILDVNDASLVLKLTCRGRAILFPADIQELPQRALALEPPSAIAADVLVAPHHGSAELPTPRLLEVIQPRHLIASSDRTLSSRQRQFDQLPPARSLLRTSRCGAITLRIDTQGQLTINTFR